MQKNVFKRAIGIVLCVVLMLSISSVAVAGQYENESTPEISVVYIDWIYFDVEKATPNTVYIIQNVPSEIDDCSFLMEKSELNGLIGFEPLGGSAPTEVWNVIDQGARTIDGSATSSAYRFSSVRFTGADSYTIDLRNRRSDRSLTVELRERRAILPNRTFMTFTIQPNDVAFAAFHVFPQGHLTSRSDQWYIRFTAPMSVRGTVSGRLS